MRKRLFAALLVLIAAVLCLCGCSASGGGNDGGASPPSSETGGIVAEGVNRKIVYYVDMDIETNDVFTVKESLLVAVGTFGGYVERQNDYGDGKNLSRTYFELRIPTENLQSFLNGVGEQGKVKSKRVSSTDITTEYVSASARKSALEERKRALETILAEEGISVSDRLTVIDSLSEVNAALQELDLQLSQYDSLVDFSTVRLDIYKVNVGEIVCNIVLAVIILGLFAAVIVLTVKYCALRKKNSVNEKKNNEK